MLAVVAVLAVAVIIVVAVRFLGGGENLSGFTERVVATGLADPYEIVWGPDGFLWATEKSGKKVTRIDPRTGTKHTALDLPDAVHTAPSGQDGVLGLAFLPGNNVVYISYTYDANPAADALERRLKIVRYAYDTATGRLVDPAGHHHRPAVQHRPPVGPAAVRARRQAVLHHRRPGRESLRALLPA